MGCTGIATTLVSLCRQVEKLTQLTLPMPVRCITALLAMKPPLPPPQPPLLIGWEDNTCSTNANSSPTMSAHAVFQALKAGALFDQPLLASPVGGKDSKGNCGNMMAQSWIAHRIGMILPSPTPSSGGTASRMVGE
jgi:hypothetical protein